MERVANGNYNSLIKFANKLPIFPNIKNQRSMVGIYELCSFVRKMIDKETSGVFFPQDDRYGCTSDIVKNIAEINGKKIHLTKLLNPFVWIFMKMPGRLGSLARKAFGNLIYEKDISSQNEIKKKVLFVATVTGHILAFHIPYLKMFKDAGFEVHVASNGEQEIKYCDKHFNLNFARSPFSKNNIGAYRELKEIIEKENYNVIQCNTPVGGALTRMAAKKARKKGTRVIYMAHGFHFFKGAPIKNWLIYYPVEKYFSKYTDDLITMNDEDYNLAKKKFKAKNIHYISGVGIKKERFDITISDEEKMTLKKSLGLNENDVVITYVAELIKRKNQEMLITAMKDLASEHSNLKVLLVGNGAMTEEYKKLIDSYDLNKNVFLLGYRKDIPQLLNISDIYVATSKMEGLPINILEAKVAKLPVIATNSRGQRELIKNNENGFLIEVGDVEALKKKIKILCEDSALRKKFARSAQNGIEKYFLENVYEEVKRIYLK